MVVHGPAGDPAEEGGCAVDVEEPAVAALVQEFGNAVGEQLKLVGREPDGQRQLLVGGAHETARRFAGGWQIPQMRRPSKPVQSELRCPGYRHGASSVIG